MTERAISITLGLICVEKRVALGRVMGGLLLVLLLLHMHGGSGGGIEADARATIVMSSLYAASAGISLQSQMSICL